MRIGSSETRMSKRTRLEKKSLLWSSRRARLLDEVEEEDTNEAKAQVSNDLFDSDEEA
jgi:hypothetical protein